MGIGYPASGLWKADAELESIRFHPVDVEYQTYPFTTL